MSELVPFSAPRHVSTMSESDIAKVRELEKKMQVFDQLDIPTEHVIHGGMYARTIFVPANSLVTGVVIKVPTILIIQGHMWVFIGDKAVELNGYNTFTASPHRKQAVLAITDSFFTMMLATTAKTIEDAEREFTDEIEQLGSHRDTAYNQMLITGE